ncbi:hypothetical protein HWD08_gp079 [Salmonella phage L6jm]|uniref:Uncharacterized protein n=1 Tax=Salmonella phage L6jm TaxID=2713222 RepID=A0A6G6XQW9_9CAUD|nr:hypothetical protein HWD08_gp079 [Salmonella phage L6jm]QIG61190.1 hypothetical protein [Salmonella phage L6jm]
MNAGICVNIAEEQQRATGIGQHETDFLQHIIPP